MYHLYILFQLVPSDRLNVITFQKFFSKNVKLFFDNPYLKWTHYLFICSFIQPPPPPPPPPPQSPPLLFALTISFLLLYVGKASLISVNSLDLSMIQSNSASSVLMFFNTTTFTTVFVIVIVIIIIIIIIIITNNKISRLSNKPFFEKMIQDCYRSSLIFWNHSKS